MTTTNTTCGHLTLDFVKAANGANQFYRLVLIKWAHNIVKKKWQKIDHSTAVHAASCTGFVWGVTRGTFWVVPEPTGALKPNGTRYPAQG